MTTNWSEELHNGSNRGARAAEPRPRPGRIAAVGFPLYRHRGKVKGFIAALAPLSTGVVFVAHLIQAARKKVTNWRLDNCVPVKLVTATAEEAAANDKGKRTRREVATLKGNL